MEDLKKQLEILIDRAEEQKLKNMMYGFTHDMAEVEGQLQAFKLVKLLINTNLEIKCKDD